MKVEILPKGVNGHDDAGHTLGLVQSGAHDIPDAFVRDAAEVFEQVPMVTEVGAQHFRDGEGNVPMRNGEKNGLGEQGPEEQNLFLVAIGSPSAARSVSRPAVRPSIFKEQYL